MFATFKLRRQQRNIARHDRQYLESRVRRFLERYLSATQPDKDHFLEVVAAVALACQPENVLSFSENVQVAEITAGTASAVVMRRREAEKDRPDDPAFAFMTDATATVAVAYRRAAGMRAFL